MAEARLREHLAVALGLYRVADNATPPRWNAENPKTAPYRAAAERLAK